MVLKGKGVKSAVVAVSLYACVAGCYGQTAQERAGGKAPEASSSAVQQVNASSFGWNAEDATAILQKAFDSGVRKLVIDKQAGDWIVRPAVPLLSTERDGVIRGNSVTH